MAEIDSIVHGLLPVIRNVMGIMSLAGDSGLIGRMRESKASIDFFREAAAHFEGNPIIEAMITALVEGGDDDLTMDTVDVTQLDLNTVLAQVNGVNPLLAGVDPQTAYDVRAFIYGIAESVAAAAGGGLFGGGDKVNETEALILDSLHTQLGLG